MKKIIVCCLFSIYAVHISAQKFAVLKDIQPGTASSFPGSLVLAENKLFFSADDTIHGDELWVSDGTPNTTKMLLDINPGAAGSFPQNIIYMNGALYFTATDGISGKELWKLTLSGMSLQKLTTTTVASPFWSEDGFIVYNNTLYFSFDDGIHGAEVWKTNGTVAGTVLAKDMRPGLISTSPRQFFIFKDKLFFLGEDNIDTQALYVIKSDDTGGRFFNCGEGGCDAFTTLKDAFYFFSDDQTFSSPDNELYRSDGTIAGTHIVKEINANGAGTYFDMTASGNWLYFAADDGLHGIEPWKSDGTANGTQLIKDITPGRQNSTPTNMIAYQDKVIFQAFQQPGNGATWISDGTAAGTAFLANMLVNNTGSNHIEANNRLLFEAYVPGFGFELCSSDGTSAGTGLALDINKGIWTSAPDMFTPRGNTLFFVASDDKKGTEIFGIAPLQFTGSVAASIAVNNINTRQEPLLKQNSPNPFSDKTTIPYVLPEHYTNAAVIVVTTPGHLVKTIPLSGHGIGNLDITATNLAAGVYFYSLVIDGKVIATKSCMINR